jgi:hypothetical protein
LLNAVVGCGPFGDNVFDAIASALLDLPKYRGADEPAQSPNVIVAVTRREIAELGGLSSALIGQIRLQSMIEARTRTEKPLAISETFTPECGSAMSTDVLDRIDRAVIIARNNNRSLADR